MITHSLPNSDSRKIVEQALSFQTPDRLPIFDEFWPEFTASWRTKNNLPPEADIEDYFRIDLQVPVANETFFSTHMREIKRENDFIYFNDGWGRIIKSKPGTYFMETVERDFREPSDLDKLQFDPPALDSRYESLLREVNHYRRKEMAVFVKIGGLFIRGSFFRGETEFLMDLAGDESFARAIVEKMEAHFTQVGLESLRRANAYDFGLWIFDDMCNINAPMFSPQTYERVFMPSYMRMIKTFKAAGARWVCLHCDGNLTPLLDWVVATGFDGINPVEPAAGMDVVALMEKYRGRLAFIGGVCNTHVLPSGDSKRIREHVERIVEAGKEGGLVIGTHSVGPDISLESCELYREIVKKHGLYK